MNSKHLGIDVFAATLGPLVSAPGSPSRLISLSQNTSFPLLPQLTGAVGSQVNHGPSNLINNNVVTGNNLNRVLPPGTSVPVEKSRLGMLNGRRSFVNMTTAYSRILIR